MLSLVRRLPQVLLGIIQLGFEQSNLSLQALVRVSVRSLFVLVHFSFCYFGIGFIEVLFQRRDLVLQRSDFLFALDGFLFERLVLCFGCFSALQIGVCLCAELC